MKLDEQTIRLYVYTKMTDSYFSTSDDFPDQQGCVLHVYDLPVLE